MFSKMISSLGPIPSWYPLIWHFLSLPVLKQGFPKKSLPSPSSLPLVLTQPFCSAPVSAQNFSRSCSLACCRTPRWRCWEGQMQWWSSSVLQVRDLGRVESDIAAPPPTRQRNPNCSPWLLPRCQKVQRREVLLSIGSLYPRKKGDTRQRHPPRAPRARHFAKFFKFSFSDIEPNCACFSSTINQGRCYSRGRCTDTHQGQETLRNSLNLLSRKCSHISHHATYYQICQVLLPFLGNSFTPAF